MDGVGEDLFSWVTGMFRPCSIVYFPGPGIFLVTELNTFRKINSRLQGHPTTHEDLPGVRVASGSLGQEWVCCWSCLCQETEQRRQDCIFSARWWRITGRTELGSHHVCCSQKVDNLIATVDYNGQQIDGPTNLVMSLGNLHAKFESFGWELLEMDGNDMDAVVAGLENTKSLLGKDKPVAI